MGRSSSFIVLPLLLLTFSSIIITQSRVAEARLTTKILFPPEEHHFPDLDISVQPPLPDFILHPKLPPLDDIQLDLPFPELPFSELTAHKAVKKTP